MQQQKFKQKINAFSIIVLLLLIKIIKFKVKNNVYADSSLHDVSRIVKILFQVYNLEYLNLNL